MNICQAIIAMQEGSTISRIGSTITDAHYSLTKEGRTTTLWSSTEKTGKSPGVFHGSDLSALDWKIVEPIQI